MKIVRTLLQHHIHDRAAVIAELGGKAIVLNFELLHDLDRRLVVDVGVAALALFRRADGTAIERNLGCGVALTVGHEIGPGRVVVGDSRTGGFCHSTRQEHQAKHAAAVQWNVPHVLVGDISAERSILRVQQGRSRGHLHRGDQSQRMQREVNRRLLRDLQHHILFRRRPKTRSIGLNGVNRGPQPGQNVKSVIVAARGLRNSGGVVCNANGRIGDQGATLVLNDTANLRGVTGLPPGLRYPHN